MTILINAEKVLEKFSNHAHIFVKFLGKLGVEVKSPIQLKGIYRKTSIYALLTMPKPLTVWITINWKILKEMGIPDHLTCLLRICMQVGKQQLELDMEQQTGSKSRKEYVKAVYCHPAYLT